MFAITTAKSFIIGICLIILGVIVACGEEATPTSLGAPTATATPAATPTPTATPLARVEPTGTLNMALAELGPPNFSLHEQGYNQLLYDQLITQETMFATSPEGLTIPRLVKEWEVDPTGLVYTFNLREGIPWIDPQGRDFGVFTADDLIWSFKEVNRPGFAHGSRGIRQIFFATVV